MPTNDFLDFCNTDSGTNLLSQADYIADPQRVIGNQPGVARSKLVNKAIRQATFITKNFAQFISNTLGQDVLDNGVDADLLAQIEATFLLPSIVTKTSSYTITPSDGTIICDATSGSFNITLPDPADCQVGQKFVIKRKDSTIANQVSLIGTIDGATDWKLYTINESLEIQTDQSVFTEIFHQTKTPLTSLGTVSMTGSGGGTVTKASVVLADLVNFDRDGGFACFRIMYAHNSATGASNSGVTGDYLFGTTLVMDTSKTGTYTTAIGSNGRQSTNQWGVGQMGYGLSVGQFAQGCVSVYDSTHVRLNNDQAGAPSVTSSCTITATNVSWLMTFRVPILGWKP